MAPFFGPRRSGPGEGCLGLEKLRFFFVSLFFLFCLGGDTKGKDMEKNQIRFFLLLLLERLGGSIGLFSWMQKINKKINQCRFDCFDFL